MSHKMGGGIFGGASSSSGSTSNPFTSTSGSTNQSTGLFGQSVASGSTSSFGTTATGTSPQYCQKAILCVVKPTTHGQGLMYHIDSHTFVFFRFLIRI